MSIALYFGSFNPIHIGHLIIAQSVLLQPEIEKVWFVISPQNPLKNSESLLAESRRYYLAQIATEDNPNFYVSNVEFSMPRPNYTIDTLAYLKEQYPNKSFSLLVGGDNMENFHKWKNYEEILNKYKIYVYKRSKIQNEKFKTHQNIIHLDVPLMDISSTLIRERIKSHQSIQYLVTDQVRDEIEKGRYYL
jgi:nicotinate-nucleotide adenylyltransferase